MGKTFTDPIAKSQTVTHQIRFVWLIGLTALVCGGSLPSCAFSSAGLQAPAWAVTDSLGVLYPLTLMALAAAFSGASPRIEDPELAPESCSGQLWCGSDEVLNCSGRLDYCRCWCQAPTVSALDSTLK